MTKAHQKPLTWLGDSLEVVYVLHAFEKKTQRTAKTDIDLANARYRQLLNERKKK